jgi:hypothetical protein
MPAARLLEVVLPVESVYNQRCLAGLASSDAEALGGYREVLDV